MRRTSVGSRGGPLITRNGEGQSFTAYGSSPAPSNLTNASTEGSVTRNLSIRPDTRFAALVERVGLPQ